MRTPVTAIVDWPSRSASKYGEVISRQNRGLIASFNPSLDIKWISLLEEEPPRSWTESQKMKATGLKLAELTSNLKGIVIGFGAYSAWHLTGYTADVAWGQPTIIDNTVRYGFPDVGYVMEKRGVLIPILHGFLKRISNNPPNPFDSVIYLKTPEEFCDAPHPRTTYAIDIENNPHTNTIMKIGLAWRHKGQLYACSLPWDEYSSGKYGEVAPIDEHYCGAEAAQILRGILADPESPKVGHNINFDLQHLEKRSFVINNTHDTMVAHQVLYPDAPHGLGFLGCQFAATPPWKQDFSSATQEKGVAKFQNRNQEELALYNARDCVATLISWEKQQEELNTTGLTPYYSKNLNLYRIAKQMSDAGIYWDKEAESKNREQLNGIILDTTNVLRRYIPEPLNFNSPKVLRDYFYTKMGCPVYFQTEKGIPKVDKDAIGAFKSDPRPEVKIPARALEAHRNAQKFLSSYLDSIQLSQDGRVHPEISPNDAKTGRWKIKNPAIQTLPQKMIRDCYAVPPGKYMIYPDYSQLELRVIAALAKDEPLLQSFASGIRIHTQNAKDVFLAAWREGDKEQEKMSKTTVFTINYGGAASTIHQRLITSGYNVTLEFCEKLLENWFSKHPALKSYLDATYKLAVEQRYLELPLSKRRLTWWRKPRPQETANWPIQATAADIVDEAIAKFADMIDWKNTLLIGQVHDALLIETDDVVGTCEILKECMEYTWPITVGEKTYPLQFSVGYNINTNWADVKEYKSLEAVKKEFGK